MLRWPILAMLVLLLARAAAAPAATLVLDEREARWALGRYLEVLEDPAGTLRFDDLRRPEVAARFVPSGADRLNFGYTRSAYWLKLRLDNLTASRGEYLLEVAFPSIDTVDLYAPVWVAGGEVEHRLYRGGDQQPFTERAVPHRNHVFRLWLAPGTTETLVLRVASASVLTVPLELWTPEAFARADEKRMLVYGLLYGGALALFLYNLMLFLSLRDRAYLYYVLYTASFGIYLFSVDGFGFQFLWPGSVWWANHAVATSLSMTLGFGALFGRLFVDMPARAPRAALAVGAISAAGFALAACAATGALLDYGTVLRSLSLLGAAAAVITLWVAVLELVQGSRTARFFLLAWSALLVFIVLGALRNFALVPTNFLTVNGLHIGFALDILLLSFGLADRINAVERRAADAQRELIASQEALLDATRASGRELEARIAERTDELRRSNEQLQTEALERERLMRQLREREEHLRFMAQHDPLTGLPNRLSMQQRLELAIALAKRQRKKLAVMLVDLDGFKTINDTRGHLAGDQALSAVAGRLRSSVRGSDTVARYGGDEFVVLAGSIDRREDAAMIAEKIADMVNVPLALEGGMARVGCSIGISLYPEDAADVDGLIAKADAAMYAAKAQRRQRYAFYVAG